MPERPSTEVPEGSLFLFDGSALAYRSHFAMARSGLSSSEGVPTGATFGFATDLQRILDRVRPAYAATVFDTSAPTFRHELYAEYKATRQKMPDELVEQLPYLHRAAALLGTRVLSVDGYEADDVIGTLAARAGAGGVPVFIVTADKDFMQLVDGGIRLYNIMKKGQEVAVIGPAEVRQRFGVPPERIVDVLALMGDSSDNVPGVPGIGEKTAARLVQRFGALEDVLEHASEAGGRRVAEALRQHAEQARLSRRLVTIETGVPLEEDLDALAYGGPQPADAMAFFQKLGFRALAESMAERLESDGGTVAADYRVVASADELDALVERLAGAELLAVDTETDSLVALEARLVGVSLSARTGEAFYVPLNADPPLVPGAAGEPRGRATLERLRPLLERELPPKCGQNVKYDLLVLRRHGIDLRGVATDSMVASYLLEPHERERNLDALALRHCGHRKIKTQELIGRGRDQLTMDLLPVEDVGEYACEDADFTLRLARLFLGRLEGDAAMLRLHDEVEIPLVRVLADMEEAGVRVDREALKAMARGLEKEAERIEREVHEIAGHEFNIQSPKQLGPVLFEELRVHEGTSYRPRKTKTGWATGQAVLEALSGHPLPAKILEYRSLTKLLGTYVRPLPDLVNPRTGRIHTSYNQGVAATGRLSSSEPNLQNIPIRTETGRRIRAAFLPTDDGHRLLSADYSQIELRIMAHLSGDEKLIEAFREDRDIHRDTAARVFGVTPEEVTPTLRGRAKAINFGILYGMGPQRLSRDTGLGLDDARKFIQRYFETFPAVRDFLEGQKDFARREGYVQTLLGRRRPIPDINSTNGMLRSQAENMAVNTPVQGSAADILKVAMVRIHGELSERGSGARMILTVHDELVLDVPLDELDDVRALVVHEMSSAHPLDVPLKVDAGVGRSWLEAH